MMNVPGKMFQNRRRAQRAPVQLPASVVTMSAYQFLEVVNLSPTGAKLRGLVNLEIGKPAMFRLDQFQVLCKIVWVQDDLCGVRFDEPVPARVLAQFRKAGDTAHVSMVTADEQLAADEWNSAIAI